MERRAITVEGIVQGVGFRPFVYALAKRLRLRGFVKNQTGRVLIEAEGTPSNLDRFLRDLREHSPPLARINSLSCRALAVRGDAAFVIESSEHDADSPIFISPDVATCDDCLAELFDPADRHYRYPFLNCTNCGPRLTIIQGAPYDRARTTMASFPMCPDCAAEYHNPADRRFHAQPAACPACGPRLSVCTAAGQSIETADPLAYFVEALRGSRIGALKGLGGFHLVCDAGDEEVVRELRNRKHRDEKPFAVMVSDRETAERFCEIDTNEAELLRSPRRPIVLLKKRAASMLGSICDSVAPHNPRLGVMLPYTALHHLLLEGFPGRSLVMTSGNRSDEPIAYEDADAFERLSGIADLFLVHNRPIHVRCDDSVTRIVDSQESPVRRSRGYAPQPVALSVPCARPILAVGGQLKGVFALGRDRQAFLSHHLGDLDHWDAYRAFVRDVGLYEELFAVAPELIVHDLHPDYASTNYARGRSAATEIPLLAVQHHHAHVASCMAEHGLDEPVIGVSFDGTGYGTDGVIWGGEFLVADYRHFRRAAHLRYVGLPGGDSAVREPWRMAVAQLRDADLSCDSLKGRVDGSKLRTINQMLDRGINTPLTSSAGRLFDAIAALAGVRDTVTYEGQAAIELEWLASELRPDGAYPFELTAAHWPKTDGAPATREVDTRPLIREVVADVQSGIDARRIARRFHATIVEIIAATCVAIREETQIEAVVLSGGVFMNALVASQSAARLSAEGFRVYRHVLVPPNDGGLSLGQLAIGAAVLAAGEVASIGEPHAVVATVGSARTTRVSELQENRDLSSCTSAPPQFRRAQRPEFSQEG
ncbi:MAG TPA: carbamoyltransferase HypF [Planctomycetaceae bacterium]|jgi:hydrogenase maturation protein HypF|nr:carbamoyltransferase HypF [Planctomycetaceae bacterium]